MAMLPQKQAQAAPSPGAPSSVEVRRYGSAADYQRDATPMAAAGWAPASQVEATGKFPVAAGILALIGVGVALVLSTLIGVAIVVIAILIGMVSRKKELVVTYRYDPGR